VLAATLEPALGQGRRELALLAVFSWSVGVFLYGAVGVFVAARMLLYPLRPEDLTPPYWVAMGATAITVVAGARIVEMANAPMVAATRGLVAGTSVVFWAFGSWLLAPLIAAGIWRHVVHRVPLRYEAALWSVVFPLGMYGVGGDYLGQADRLPIVEHIGEVESWVALAVWTGFRRSRPSKAIKAWPRQQAARAARTSNCWDSWSNTAPASFGPQLATRQRRPPCADTPSTR
jgi:tellurite resistance protein TehA-like permease